MASLTSPLFESLSFSLNLPSPLLDLRGKELKTMGYSCSSTTYWPHIPPSTLKKGFPNKPFRKGGGRVGGGPAMLAFPFSPYVGPPGT